MTIKLVSTRPEDWGTDEQLDGEIPGARAGVYLTPFDGVLEVYAVHLTADGEEEVVTDLPRIARWLGWSPATFEAEALAHLDAVAEEAAAFEMADATYDRSLGWR